MRTSWKLGRFAGTDVYLHPSLLIALLILAGQLGEGLVEAAPFATMLFGSVLLHEFGHVLMARRYGIETLDVTLSVIGGVARLRRPPRSSGPEILIALAGPAVNLAIVVGLLAVARVGNRLGFETHFLLYQTISVNAGLLLFNLLPIFPMDGGRVLRAALTSLVGRWRATDYSASIGQALAVAGGFVGLFYQQWTLAIAAIFVYLAAAMERRRVWMETRPDSPRSAFVDAPQPPPGFRWATRGDGIWRLVPQFRRWGRT